MNTRETAEAFVSAIEYLDIEAAAPYCADHFTFSGVLPEAIGFEAWGVMAANFQNAFPDWRYNAHIESVEGDTVHLTVAPSGTHEGDLDLSAQGMGIISQTGNSFALPREHARIRFEDDKAVNFHIDVLPEGGVRGILAQLGVAVP